MTATQLCEVIERLREAGHWREGDLDILIVFDAGYDVTRLAFLLADLPVQPLGRVRFDRVFYSPPPPRAPGATGRPATHGHALTLADLATHPAPDAVTVTDTSRYGTAKASTWNQLHPCLTHRGSWATHDGPLPVLDSAIIRLQVQRLPGDRTPKPVWLWHSRPTLAPSDVDRLWRAYLRRFDLEHTFRFLTQTLGWTRPRVRTPEQGERWTWLILAAHTQLRLARHLTQDLRRPWEKPVTDPRRGDPSPSPPSVCRTSARRPPCRPANRNPHTPGPDAHQGPKTSSVLTDTTSANTPLSLTRPQDGLNDKLC